MKSFGPSLKLSSCLIIFFASAFQAFGIHHIHEPSAVTEGGVLGAVLLIDYWLHISPAISSFVLNAACFLLGWRILGKEFIAYSCIATIGFSCGYGVFEQFPQLWPDIAQYPLIATIAGAFFIGIGAGLCVRAGGATSGDDALAMSFSRLFHIPIERIYLVSDLVVLLLSLSYIPLQRIIFSLLTVVLSGQIIGIIQKIGRNK